MHSLSSFFFSSKLVVNLLKADELPEAKNDYPRVYVTINLLHNNNINKANQDFKSKVQQGTYSPDFNERFEFDISDKLASFIRLVVWYVDSFSQGECLGMVEQNLDKLIESEEGITDEPTIVCKDIQRIARVKQMNLVNCLDKYVYTMKRSRTTIPFNGLHLQFCFDPVNGSLFQRSSSGSSGG